MAAMPDVIVVRLDDEVTLFLETLISDLKISLAQPARVPDAPTLAAGLAVAVGASPRRVTRRTFLGL